MAGALAPAGPRSPHPCVLLVYINELFVGYRINFDAADAAMIFLSFQARFLGSRTSVRCVCWGADVAPPDEFTCLVLRSCDTPDRLALARIAQSAGPQIIPAFCKLALFPPLFFCVRFLTSQAFCNVESCSRCVYEAPETKFHPRARIKKTVYVRVARRVST